MTVTFNVKDFLGPIRDMSLEILVIISGESDLKGEGIVHWKFRDDYGWIHKIRTNACYVLSSRIMLLTPQTYF